MFRENKVEKQLTFADSTFWMNPGVVKKLSKTWAPIFYEQIFCKIDEKPFAVLYSDTGRPNFPINIILSLEYIKHIFDYTDDQLVENFYFNYLINYALGIKSIGEVNMAERTLYEFRKRVYRYALNNPAEEDLIFKQFINLTKNFIEVTGISTTEQRMDSSFITSNIKKAGRLALAFDVLVQAVKTLPEEKLPEDLKEILKPEFKTKTLYLIKTNETNSKFENLLNLCKQVEQIAADISPSEIKDIDDIEILQRFLIEQAEYDHDTKTLKPKDKKDIAASSLQSAYDKDATYRTKAGKGQSGYSLNVTETCNKENDIQLITDYTVAQNIKSDVELIKERVPVIKQSTDCEDVYTDGGYYSSEAIEVAKKENIDIHFTDMTGREPSSYKLPVTDFKFAETGEITYCPQNKKPINSSIKKGQVIAHFNKDDCANCPLQDKCSAKTQKKTFVVRIAQKAIIATEQRTLIKQNLKENTSKRAAVEGTISALKRGHSMEKLKVRGLHKCSIVSGLKITAQNFKRVVRCLLEKAKDKKIIDPQGVPMPC